MLFLIANFLFQIIDIELGNEDYLQIYDGSTLDSNILDRLSSQSVYSNPIISTGNSILIYFSSTSFTRAKGFLLSYKAGIKMIIQFIYIIVGLVCSDMHFFYFS